MDSRGYYDGFGGAFIPEILFETFKELNVYFEEVKKDPSFWEEYLHLMASYSCRPTPLTHAENITDLEQGYYYYDSPFAVERSLYIGDVLYTISDTKVKMNNLDNLNYINEVQLSS